MAKKYHSNRYTNYIQSESWRTKSRWIRSLTRPWWLGKYAKGRCCLIPTLAAQETHHLTYFFILNIGWNWFGFEQPVWHLVPLSKYSHKLISKPFFWRQPVRFFVNTYLRISFIILWSICKPFFSLPLWFGAYYATKYTLIPIILSFK